MKTPKLGQHVKFTTKATEYSSAKTFSGIYDQYAIVANGAPCFRAYSPNGEKLKSGKPALSTTSYTADAVESWEPLANKEQPARQCPDCKVAAPFRYQFDTERHGLLKYYKCPSCKCELVKRPAERFLELAA